MNKSIVAKMKAGFPLVSIETIEESKVKRTILDVGEQNGRIVRFFSISMGVIDSEGKTMDLRDPVEFIQKFSAKDEPSINVILDPTPFFQDPMFCRVLKDSISAMREGNMFIFLSPVMEIPRDIEHLVSSVESKLPDRQEIGQLFDEIVSQLDGKQTDETKERAIDALIGLSSDEAADALALSIVEGSMNGEARVNPKAIMDEKCRALSRSGYMKVIPASKGDCIGGLRNLRDWIKRRKVCFEKEAKDFGLPTPKGMLLVGVPGCGKSLTAKQIPRDFDIPLIQLNMGAIFGSLVGESEKNIRKAIETAEAMSPCVLWIDELDKQLSGDSGSHETTRRVIAELLTWLEEKESPVFVVATANNIQGISKTFPEMLRKGRWDEMFFVDLPSPEERASIFSIHIEGTARRNPIEFGIKNLAEATEGFSGAEIKAVVVDAMYRAFEDSNKLHDNHVKEAIKNTIPQSQSARESIQGLREWARSRCLNASVQKKHSKKRKIEI